MRFQLYAIPAFLLLTALVPFTPDAAAAETVTVKDVVISATRTEKILQDVPSSIAVVTEDDMRQRPVLTISDALRDVPGVQVLDNTMAGVHKVSIRGEVGQRVLVMVDGIKIPDQKSMDGAAIMIDPAFIERIEVIKGPASVLYGSEAIGGAINIITKKGGERPLQGAVYLAYDSSVDAFIPKGSLFGKIGNVGYRLTGSYTDADDRHAASGDVDRTAFINRDFTGYIDYQWDKATLAAGYEYFRNASSPMPGSQEDPAQIVNMGLPRWQREKWYLHGEARELSDYLAKLSVTVYRQQILKDFWNDVDAWAYDPAMMGIGGTLHVRTHPETFGNITTHGTVAQSEWALGENNYLVAGLDVYQDRLKSTDQNHTRGDFYPSTGMPPVIPNFVDEAYDDNLRGKQNSFAAFIQDEWTFLPDWTLTAGVRQIWIQSELTESTRYKQRSAHDSQLVGSVGLVWSGIEDWRFRAHFGQGYRYPNLQQLYMGTSHGSSGTTYGNPALKPERSDSYEVGARYTTPNWTFDLAVYHSRAEDYIAAELIPGTRGDRRFVNLDEARTSGVELTLEYTFTDLGLTPYVNGNFMRRRLERSEGTTYDSGNPRWMGSAGLRFEREVMPELTFTADLYGRFASSAKEEITADDTQRYAGWGTLNFNVGAAFGMDMQYFANLAFNNILDKSYRTARGSIDEPGFNVMAQIGMEF